MRRAVPLVLTSVASAVLTITLAAAPSTGQGAAHVSTTAAGRLPARHPVVLNAVKAVADADVWAVGSQRIDINTTITWTQHWNGRSWRSEPSPNPTSYDTLDGVDAMSATDAWAVGGTYQHLSPVIEHWDGSSWKLVKAPGTGGLYSVSMAGPDDVWAVGRYPIGGEGPYRTLVQHWDGTAWSVVPSRNPKGTFSSELRSVTALGPDDVWALGTSQRKSRTVSALIEHWDGSTWQIVDSPHGRPNELLSVAAVASDDVWAVGHVFRKDDFTTRGLTEHWDGQRWSRVASADTGRFSTGFTGVSAAASDDVWAVGQTILRSSGPPTALIEHWNGTRWTVVPGDARPGGSALRSISAVSPTSAWTVGGYAKYHSATLIEHWDGSAWTEQP